MRPKCAAGYVLSFGVLLTLAPMAGSQTELMRMGLMGAANRLIAASARELTDILQAVEVDVCCRDPHSPRSAARGRLPSLVLCIFLWSMRARPSGLLVHAILPAAVLGSLTVRHIRDLRNQQLCMFIMPLSYDWIAGLHNQRHRIWCCLRPHGSFCGAESLAREPPLHRHQRA